jgi:RNA polymerase sigma-B factor
LADLEQTASLALVKAVDRFDPAVGVRFSTFAVPTIMGELRRHFRDRTGDVRVSRRIKELHLELKTANETLAHDLGRTPSVEELAEALDRTVEEVLEALEAGASYRASSLTMPGAEGEEHEIDLPAGGDGIDLAGTRLEVRDALATLDERDRRIVYLRFYLGLTQAEIAKDVGVSQVHVSRLLRASLAHLGDELGTG